MAQDYTSIIMESVSTPGWLQKLINVLTYIKEQVIAFFRFILRKLRELLPKKKAALLKEQAATNEQKDIIQQMNDMDRSDPSHADRVKSSEEKRQEIMIREHEITQDRFMTSFVDMIMNINSYMSTLPYLASRIQEYLNHREKKALVEMIMNSINLADNSYTEIIDRVNATSAINETYRDKFPDGPTLITIEGCDMLQDICSRLGKDIAKNLGNVITALQNASVNETDEAEAKTLIRFTSALQSYVNHDTTLVNMLIRFL